MKLKIIGAFIFGTGLGVIGGIFGTKKYYQKQAAEEISLIRNEYLKVMGKNIQKDFEDMVTTEEAEVFADHDKIDTLHIDPVQMTDYNSISNANGPEVDKTPIPTGLSIDDIDYSEEDEQERELEEAVERYFPNSPDSVVRILDEDIMLDIPYADDTIEDLNYYVNDDVLTDEMDEPLDIPTVLTRPIANQIANDPSRTSWTIHNKDMGGIYRIKRINGSYMSMVLGIGNESDANV